MRQFSRQKYLSKRLQAFRDFLRPQGLRRNKEKSEEIYSFFFYFILIFAIIEKKAVIKWIHQK